MLYHNAALGNHLGLCLAVGLLQQVPYLLRDKRHKRMQHIHQTFKDADGCVVGLFVDGRAIGGLHHLQIPRAEVVPHQFVSIHQRLAQAVLVKVFLYLLQHAGHPLLHPFYSHLVLRFALHILRFNLPSFHQTQSVPYLVGKVAALLTDALVKRQVVAGRCRQQHTHTHTVSAVFLYQLYGVG